LTHSLTTEGLSLAYGETLIVSDLDLHIPIGQITVLVGANGSGKSTLLRGIARLLKPRAGGVYLDGKQIHTLPTRTVARRLGILPQGPVASEGLTVRDLVAQGRYPHQGMLRRWSDDDERATQQALALTRMADLADRPLDTLSGGQRQRAWIAMALAQETDILLLDEPTTFLDLAHQVEVLDLLQDLNERGRTIVMVLHDLNQACRYADHLVALRDGQVVAAGAPADVITPGVVHEVFGLQCQIVADPLLGTPMCVPMCRLARRAELERQRDEVPLPHRREVAALAS